MDERLTIEVNQRRKALTKMRILEAAADIFSDTGFGVATMRDLAKAAGITAGSIYNHFESKDDILICLFELYAENFRKACPTVEELLTMAETASLCDLLTKLDLSFPKQQSDMLSKIVSIAVREFSAGFDNEAFIREIIFDGIKQLLSPLLNRLIELGRIEPMDVDGFITFYTCYAFGVTLLNNTPFGISRSEWTAGMSMAFRLVKPTGDNAGRQ